MRLVLLGPPGSGKGTQSETLAVTLGVPHIATGDLFRAEMAAETELGQLAKEYISHGNLVPDEVVNAMVADRLSQPDGADFLLDGYPRTVQQAEALDEILGKLGRPLSLALNLDVPDEAIVGRAVGRLLCSHCGAIYHLKSKPPKVLGVCDICRSMLVSRDDDTPSTVRHRLAVYHRITEPVLEYYRAHGLLRSVSGVGAPDAIGARLRAELAAVC